VRNTINVNTRIPRKSLHAHSRRRRALPMVLSFFDWRERSADLSDTTTPPPPPAYSQSHDLLHKVRAQPLLDDRCGAPLHRSEFYRLGNLGHKLTLLHPSISAHCGSEREIVTGLSALWSSARLCIEVFTAQMARGWFSIPVEAQVPWRPPPSLISANDMAPNWVLSNGILKRRLCPS
jgi:hypothetical protein